MNDTNYKNDEKFTNEQYREFLHRFRNARYAILEDAENFIEICYVLEDFGLQYGKEKKNGLGGYIPTIESFLNKNSLLDEKLSINLEFLKAARNDKSHQGVYARNIAQHAIRVCIKLEEAIIMKLSTLEDIMIDNVIFAKPFMNLAKIRKLMLRYSFSYLPYCHESKKNNNTIKEYYLLPDYTIAQIWNKSKDNDKKKEDENKYTTPFSKIFEENKNEWKKIELVCKNEKIKDFNIPEKPILLKTDDNEIVGILTPFDFL